MESFVLSSSGSSSSDLEGIINDANFTATSNSTSLKKVIQDVNENSKDKELMMEFQPSTSKSMITSKQMNPNILNVEYLPNICLQSTEGIVTTQANSTATLTSSAIKNEQEEVTNEVNEQIQPNICSKVVITGKNTTVKDNKSAPSSASIKKPKSKKTTQNSVVIVDCTSDDESGNDLNREFATTNFSEPILRTFITVHKTNKAAQNIRKKKAIIADLKSHLRCGTYQPTQQVNELQKYYQEYDRQNARRAHQTAGRAHPTAGPFSRRVFSNNGPLPVVFPVVPPDFYANIQQSVEETIRRTRETVLILDEMAQNKFPQL